jgi:hypothetical protein
MKTLYGYAGRLASGKFFCMSQQVEHLKTTGNSLYLTSFADPIKMILRNSFNLTKTGKITTGFSNIDKDYVRTEIVSAIGTLIKQCNHSKFDVSDKDILIYVQDVYSNCEDEFHQYVVNASMGKDYDYSFRRLGQLLGTEIGRTCLDSIWVDTAFKKVKTVFKNDLADYAFIEDCRFKNEQLAFEKFKEETPFNAKIIGVYASDETRAKRRNLSLEELKKQDEHGSEKEIDDIINSLDKKDVIINEN